jgi:hypothetical protein
MKVKGLRLPHFAWCSKFLRKGEELVVVSAVVEEFYKPIDNTVIKQYIRVYEKAVRTNATNKFDFDSIVRKLASVPQSDCHLYWWKPVRMGVLMSRFACANSYLANN